MDISLIYSLAAGICTFLGAVLVMMQKGMGQRELGFFLGLASGVMIAVVLFDLIPSAIERKEGLSFLLGCLGGAIFLWGSSIVMSIPQAELAGMQRLGYLIMLGIALHDLPEGMAISLGYEVNTRIAALIALGIGIHNMPEGMAIAAPLVMSGIPRLRIALQILAVALVTPLGTIIGKLAVTRLPNYFGIFLGVAGGLMVCLVLFQLWPESVKCQSRARYLGLICGLLVIFIATFIL